MNTSYFEQFIEVVKATVQIYNPMFAHGSMAVAWAYFVDPKVIDDYVLENLEDQGRDIIYNLAFNFTIWIMRDNYEEIKRPEWIKFIDENNPLTFI